SQRECSGFNGPPPSICAEEPVSILPEAFKRIGEGVPVGVLQPHSFATPPISNSSFRSPLLLVCPPSITFGVGQPASVTAPSKSIPPVCFGVLSVFGPPLGVFGV